MPGRRKRMPGYLADSNRGWPRSNRNVTSRVRQARPLQERLTMHVKTFLKSGNPKTLFSAFLYFDMSFMIWVILGSLGNAIATQFQLTAAQKGLMTGLPVLSGSVMRIVLGTLADRIGGKKTALIGLSLTFVPLLLGGLMP